MNFKRSFRNITQSVLYVNLLSFENNSPESSSRDGLSKKVSLDRDGKESVSTLMSEEYAEEDEIASFTDDYVSFIHRLAILPPLLRKVQICSFKATLKNRLKLRLTFWLSNSIVLRAIISHAKSSGNFITEKGTGTMRKGKRLPLKWESISQEKSSFKKDLDGWDDPQTFVDLKPGYSLELSSLCGGRISLLICSSQKMVASQNRFPCGKNNLKEDIVWMKKCKKNYTFEIWKKAFQGACERLCPVRGDWHKCGCLSILAKLVMEQCVARLDVALFNALLHESDDETTTDPVADPIINRKVLPVPPGKSSFGTGVQLKNVVSSVMGK